jgi:SH3-like domain-containing protein
MAGYEVGGSARDVVVAGPTKTGIAGQARGNWARATFVGLALAIWALTLAACNGPVAEGRDCPAAVRARSVSGFCVPRYVSLKRGEVYGRKGPGKDYPALFVYHARGLPVQVVAETSEWRRICDPDGGAVWVNRAMIDGRRTVLARGPAPVDLVESVKSPARITGRLAARALATLDDCKAGWCRVKAGGVSGWARSEALWGVAEGAQCH